MRMGFVHAFMSMPERLSALKLADQFLFDYLKWVDYSIGWNPTSESSLSVWQVLHQLICIFKTQGENGAGEMIAAVQAKAEAVRQLSYRLYTLCERAGWAEDARAYNELVTSWSAIESAAAKAPSPQQAELFDV